MNIVFYTMAFIFAPSVVGVDMNILLLTALSVLVNFTLVFCFKNEEYLKVRICALAVCKSVVTKHCVSNQHLLLF